MLPRPVHAHAMSCGLAEKLRPGSTQDGAVARAGAQQPQGDRLPHAISAHLDAPRLDRHFLVRVQNLTCAAHSSPPHCAVSAVTSIQHIHAKFRQLENPIGGLPMHVWSRHGGIVLGHQARTR